MDILKRLITSVFLLSALVFVLGFGSCGKSKLIDGVAVRVEPNIETLKVVLKFAKDVQSDLGGTFPIVTDGRDYGSIEIEPKSAAQPFNVGFRFNLGIVNEQNFVDLEPVLDLPSGQPIPIPGLNRALARVSLEEDLSSHFGVYAYVDVIGKEWVGMSMTLKFLSHKFFPPGLSISQGFAKGPNGAARVIAAVFGPKIDSKGQLLASGGIALLANAKALLGGGHLMGFDQGDGQYMFHGPAAHHYRSHPKDAAQLGRALKEALKINGNDKTTL